MVQCWLVDCIFMPAEWNARRMKFFNKIPLKNGPIFSNASRERFYTYRVFKREKDAIKLNRKLLRAYTNSWERERKGMGPPWRVVGGCEIQEFPSVKELEDHLRSFTHKFFRIRIWGKKLKRGKQVVGGAVGDTIPDTYGLKALEVDPETDAKIREDFKQRMAKLRDDDSDEEDDDDDDETPSKPAVDIPPPPPTNKPTYNTKDLFDPNFAMTIGGKTYRLSDYIFDTPLGPMRLAPKKH